MTWPFARRRVALGVAEGPVPVSVWLIVGFTLGPAGLQLLTPEALAHLDAIVSVALAILGIFAGLALAPRVRGASSLLIASFVESGITALVVGGAALVLISAWRAPLAGSAVIVALSLAAAAAASSAGAAEGGEGALDHALRIADLDDVLPIVLAAAVIGAVGPGVLRGLLVPTLIGAVTGAIGWLLFERSASAAERGVFVLGAVALAGGAPAYAGVSPLLTGLVAGMFWRRVPGRADAIIAGDLQRFHHPLVVLLVVVAGALTAPAPLAIFLFAALVVFRLSGKVIGGVVAAQAIPVLAGELLGAYLVPPGVIGIAVALNLQQVAPDGTALLSAVAGAAIVFDVVALAVTPHPAVEVR